MRTPGWRILLTTVLVLVAGPMSLQTLASPASARVSDKEVDKEVDKAETQESAVGNDVSAASSVLQVSGTTNNFTVSAQHADVLSLLKLVFAQTHRQFVPDASVTGDVTFSLAGQKFDTVLSAVCRQAILRYEVDSNGIYQFRRDDEALRTLLLKTQTINRVLQEQLRRMGYTVPGPLVPDGSRGTKPASEFARSDTAGSAKAMMSNKSGPGADTKTSNSRSVRPFGAQEKVVDDTARSINSNPVNSAEGNGALSLPNMNDSTQYQMFLKQNNLVSVNTKGEEMAVRDILLDMGRQAGVSILIAPEVPRGADFVLNGYITPRPLAELLNILAYKAHLDWRWVNNRIFVTTTPQLQFYLRGALMPPPNGGITVLPSRSPGRTAPDPAKKPDSKSDPDGKPNPEDKEKPKAKE